MSNAALWVRVNPKNDTSQFCRCGIAFTRDWREVAADAATAKRLLAEQMLEVSTGHPEDLPDAPQAEAAKVPETKPAKPTKTGKQSK